MILILTQSDDEHACLVADRLERMGVEHVCVRNSDFPELNTLTLRFGGARSEGSLDLRGRRVELSEITTVWNRRFDTPQLPDSLDPESREFALEEWRRVIRSLWFLLREKFWVNPYEEARRGESKPFQLEVAQEVGLEIPRTLMTNDPAEARDFLAAFPSGIIYKPFHCFFGLTDRFAASSIYANYITDARALSDNIRLAPCIFQEYVPKKVELRVTIVGNRVFTAEIHSQESERTRLDWRRYDFKNTPHRKADLPPEVQEKLMTLLRRLNLVFACVDIIVTPDGRYIFLEVNQMGQWYWIQRVTGLPILRHLVQMLIQGTPDYDPAVARA